MKKVLWIALCGLGFCSMLAAGNSEAADNNAENKESSVDTVLPEVWSAMGKQTCGVMVKLELVSDRWQVETVGRDGVKRKFFVNEAGRLSPESVAAGDTGPIPPSGGISLRGLAQLEKDQFHGEINKIEFIAGRWVVDANEPGFSTAAGIETIREFDTQGRMISVSLIN